MIAQTATAANRVAKTQVAGVRSLVELGPKLRTMVWKIARDSADSILHGGVAGSMRKAMDIFSFAVGRFGKIRKCLPRASC